VLHMAKMRNWTDNEIILLKENYPKFGRSEKLKELFPDRTLDGICVKAAKLGLKVINNIRKGRSNEEYVSLLSKTSFISLELYKGSTAPIKHKCTICNNEWLTRPQAVLKPGAKCPVCDLKSRKHSVEYVDNILNNAGFSRLSEYTGTLNKIKLEHRVCGYVWDTRFSHIQQGSGCPLCNKGFGYLDRHNYPDIAYLYILEIILDNGEHFLKLGVSVRDVSSRIREISNALDKNLILIKPKLVLEGTGQYIINLEQKLLRDYSTKYNTSHKFVGHTELKTLDFLNTIITYIEKDTDVKIVQ